MNVLSIKDLRYLHCGPISLEINSGECVGISGDSGSGKSRLLRALADLDDHQGEIKLGDINQQEIEAHNWRKKVALLSAETYWWFDTVGDHFTDLSEENLDALGLTKQVINWDVVRLSSGEKQRLGLLRLLENEPQVLLLDEPTANLDKNNVALFEAFIAAYIKNKNACVIWISHDSDQLLRVSKKQFEIINGKLK